MQQWNLLTDIFEMQALKGLVLGYIFTSYLSFFNLHCFSLNYYLYLISAWTASSNVMNLNLESQEKFLLKVLHKNVYELTKYAEDAK